MERRTEADADNNTTSSAARGARILVVDDDREELELCARALQRTTDAPIVRESKSVKAAERLRLESFDLLITDLRMPMMDGIDLLRLAQSQDAELPVVILTGYPSVESAVATLKIGAADYITKPVNLDELVMVAERLLGERRQRRERRLLERQFDRPYAFDEIIGSSRAMQGVYETIQRVAETDVDVLVIGETGTGKELVARSIHKRSRDRKGRFVPVDCGAIPENLLESELFGYERGAFSGAYAQSMGLMEYADCGTFFLDEIAGLPLALQAKLLRALQERSFRRLGATRETAVNLRIVAASNRDPAELMEAERFRADLYYRLNVGRIELPPLRERREDIPLLADYFVHRYAGEMRKPVAGLSAAASDAISAYEWPGNVRQLQNAIKRAVAMSRGELLTPEDLPDEIASVTARSWGMERATFFQLRAEHVADFERDYLAGLLQAFGGDVASAARGAGMPRGTLYRLLKKHDLHANQFRYDS